MKKEIQEALADLRNKLLREAQQDAQEEGNTKPEEYRKGHTNGVLDFYNKAMTIIDTYVKD